MNSDIMQRAAGAFMTIRVKVSRWSGIKQSSKVARAAAEAGNADSQALGGHVKLLGKHHAELKALIAAGARINTYCYENGLPSEAEGEHMFHVDSIPQVMADLKALHDAQQQALESFIGNYSMFRKAAVAQLGEYAAGLSYPTPEEVRGKFQVVIGAPDFVPMADLERFKGLPLAQAAEWAAEAEAKAAARIENAREFVLDNTRTFVDDLQEALASGKYRTTDKKKREVERLSTQLRQLVRDFDNDPRLLALADIIDEKIMPAIKSGNLRDAASSRKEAVRRAAKTVAKGIDAHKKNAAKLKAAAAKSNKSAASVGTPVGGGMIADLI